MTVPSGAPTVAPPNLPAIPDLLSALPLGGVEWVTVLIAALTIGAAAGATAYLTRQRTPVTTLAERLGEARR